MREVKASEFKAKCLKLLDEVAATGEPIVVTKHGKPVARVERVASTAKSLRGCMKGRIEIVDPEDNLLSAWDEEQEKAMQESLKRLASDVEPRPNRRRRG